MDLLDGLVLVEDEGSLRTLLGPPSERAIGKQRVALDEHCRAFVAASPFLLMSTSGAGGTCDVSPRGDAPGFVLPLDDRTLAIPERPGNRRVDSLRNVLVNPHVGVLFMVPGAEETLRVNGRARIVREAPWMDRLAVQGKRPALAVLLEIEEAFFHCAKAFRRSRIWQPESWPARGALPSLGTILRDQMGLDRTGAEVDCELEETYAKTMY
jgi:PPOX class probable FMN-dependent enzyme